jgi:phosphatidylglycerophosphate synthase/choline kinase
MKAIITLAREENIKIERKKLNALVRLCGLTLLERNLYTLKKAGIDDFLIVCGLQYDIIKNFIEDQKLSKNFNLSLFRKSDDIPLEDDQFVVLDVTLIFDFDIIKNLIAKADIDSIICVDSSPKHVKIDIDLSKGFINTGIFLCNKGDLPISENIIRNSFISKQDFEKSKIRIYDVNGGFWFKINTEEDLKTAEDILLNIIPANEDFVGKFVRKIPAKFLIKHLIKTSITPNQVSLLTFLSFLIAAFLFSFGKYNYGIIAGMMVLLALFLDHCDGGIARLTFNTSRHGAWLDDMYDTIGFYSVIFGATIGLYIRTYDILPWIVGMLLLFSDSVVYHDSSLSKIIFGAGVKTITTTLQTYKKETVFERLYNHVKHGLYLSWAGKLLLISIGAFLNIMLIIFLILIVVIDTQWLTSLVMRFKDRNAIK